MVRWRSAHWLKSTYGLLLGGVLLFLGGCDSTEQITLEGKTMGTGYIVKYLDVSDASRSATIQAEINQRLDAVNQQMSTYRSDSELSRFNQSREVNHPFPVSAATAKVVQEAVRLNKVTEGALDITVGPLVNLWGFGPEGRPNQVPSEEEINQRRAWIGIEHLEVQGNGLVKRIPELYLDLSSIAKGYGVDVVAEYLQSQKITNYMVDIGGEVRVSGINGQGSPWRIAIEKPQAELLRSVQRVIEPGNSAVATSGDYRHYFEENGQRFSHEIDPHTARPITHHLVSITVLADSCMTADGLATGLNVLGPERAMAVANAQDIPVLMMVKTDQGLEERYSNAFKPYLINDKDK